MLRLGRSLSMLLQKRVVCTKVDIYASIDITDTSAGGY
jgi:hypothetical protein